MKYFLLIILLSMESLSMYGQRKVYVCTGPGAYKYHLFPNCSRLKKCTGSIQEISEPAAKANPNYVGLCKVCSKKAPKHKFGSTGKDKTAEVGLNSPKKNKLGTFEKYKKETK